ncbi:MAG: hypothetical protein LBU42_00105 [Prevotellaceae bacterium]|nr:hypothetical protein [Prevotellaceae bacterium]
MKTLYKPAFYRDVEKFPQKIRQIILDFTDLIEKANALTEIPRMRKMEGVDDIFRIHVTYRYIIFLKWDKENQMAIVTNASSREGAY